MDNTDDRQFQMHPIGKVKQHDDYAELQIYDKYTDAVLGLDGFSHAFVMYWFDKNGCVHLTV